MQPGHSSFSYNAHDWLFGKSGNWRTAQPRGHQHPTRKTTTEETKSGNHAEDVPAHRPAVFAGWSRRPPRLANVALTPRSPPAPAARGCNIFVAVSRLYTFILFPLPGAGQQAFDNLSIRTTTRATWQNRFAQNEAAKPWRLQRSRKYLQHLLSTAAQSGVGKHGKKMRFR